MTWVKWVLLGYGLFNIALGVEAFVAKASLPSLMGGGGAGVIVLIALALSFKWARVGYVIALLVCVGLIGRFLPAFLRDPSNVYPALTVTIASVLTAGCLAAGHLIAMRQRRASGPLA